MAEFDYEVVDGRKIRVRPQEVVSEIDENGYFVRQPNHFTEGFGEGKNPVEKGRYHLVWAKLCHWSNRASIVRELLGLEDAISVNMVDHAKHEKNLGWEFVYDKDHIDPVLGIQFLSEAYYKADDDYTGRTTVPALIDTKTGKVVNNDYTWLTNYFEVDFKPFHKKGAPDLYPEELRKDIDEMNDWLFDNINNGVYKATFARSKEAYWDAYNSFYAAMDILEKRLENQRFLFGDYVTDSDVRLYVTLARLDIRYTWQLGHTKHRLIDYPNLWGYARDLYQIPAFRNNTYFKDFANPNNKKVGALFFESFNARFLDEINFDAYWGAPHDRAHLSSDPGNKFKAGLSFEGGTGISVSNAVEAWNEKNPDKAINITYSDADTSVFLQHVADGSQDFTIIDLAMYNSYMEEFNYDVQKNDIPEDEAKMIAENSYAYYIFPQDQKDLREQVDKALKELKEDGTLTEISKKWYGQDAAPEDDKFEETIN